MNDSPPARLPLEGTRVLAIEQYGAAPYGSLFLAQMGAEVIKIEPPEGGDVSRGIGPFHLGEDDSEFFQTFNANKRSLTLNIKTPEGRVILEQLVASSQILLHNLRGDHPSKLRLTYADLCSVNAGIVCGHLTAYGRDGERASWPGYDYLMQAEAGFLSLTGEPEGTPARFGLSMIDYMTGLVLANALLAGLLKARETGIGGDVDVSLFDTAIHQLSYLATWYLNEGHVSKSTARSAHPSITPSQLVKTQDGWIFIMCQTQKFWLALIRTLGASSLGEDPRFLSMEGRLAHRTDLTEALDAIFKTRPSSDWLELLRGIVPVSPVYNLAQALDNPFVTETGMVTAVLHPRRPQLRLLANPIRVRGQRLPVKTAPRLGADTHRVLEHLGYRSEQIEALRRARVI